MSAIQSQYNTMVVILSFVIIAVLSFLSWMYMRLREQTARIEMLIDWIRALEVVVGVEQESTSASPSPSPSPSPARGYVTTHNWPSCSPSPSPSPSPEAEEDVCRLCRHHAFYHGAEGCKFYDVDTGFCVCSNTCEEVEDE